MRTVLVGAFGLIVLSTVIQPEAAARLGKGAEVVTSALTRFLSPEVAGVPDLRSRRKAGASNSKSTSSGTAVLV